MPAMTTPATIERADLPSKGTSMAEVEKKYGAPSVRQPTVGGESPKHPPITRWDYPGFSVIFEKSKVIDAVIPGAPPAIHNQDQLQPVAGSAPPMPEATVPSPDTAAPAPEATPASAAPADAPADAAPPTSAPEAPAAVATPENPNPDAPKP